MNADVEKAVEASRSPRVDALIERVMQEHPGFGASAQARYYEAVHQELAPLARDQEAEIARLQSASDMRFQQAMENGQRAQQAEALLRECLPFLYCNPGGTAELSTRITAHLGSTHE